MSVYLQHTVTHCNTLQQRLWPTVLHRMLDELDDSDSREYDESVSVLQCVVVCCSVLQCVAVCCSG